MELGEPRSIRAASLVLTIIERLTAKGEEYSGMIWVGENYSKAGLLRDLRGLRLDVAEKDCVQPNWRDIRTALLKEQGRE